MIIKRLMLIVLAAWSGPCFGQFTCPPNIDFEQGNTANWVFYTGSCCPINTPNLSIPINNRHTLTSGAATDFYGGFPVVSPGGGSYSLKLGNNINGAQAERARYYVQVPAGVNNYSLVYRYAVVFENPNHAAADQPRFEVKVFDSATNTVIPCGSFTYVSSSSLPGFSQSANGSQVWYKPWSTASIDLSGLGGKTIAVDFASGDCDLGGHFGYGYIDLNCSLFQIASVNCNGSPTTNLSAPPGFQSYQWYNASFSLVGSGQTVTIATPATSSQYHVVLTPYSGYGCPDTLTTTVAVSSMTLNASNDTFVCKGGSVQLTAAATGTGSSFTYSWTPATGLNCTTCASPVAAPAVNTTYQVTATDDNGCVRIDTVRVDAGPFATVTSQNVLCNGYATGSASLLASQGQPPYSYVWNSNPIQHTASATSLLAGNYTGIVTDNHGCSDTVQVTLSQPPAVTAAVSHTDVSCFGLSNGSAAVTAGGGQPPYSYSWNTIPAQNTALIQSVPAGSYQVTVTDDNGCSSNALVSVTQPAALDVSMLSTNQVSCTGGNNGSATASVAGGTAPYTFSWSTSPVQTTATAANLSAGNYALTVTDANGCTDTAMVQITEPQPLTALVSSTPVACFGGTTGSATVIAGGGTPPYGYSWNTSPVQTGAVAGSLAAGNYTVLVTDANGCVVSQVTSVSEPDSALTATLQSVTQVSCYGGANGAAGMTALGGTPPYSFAWNTSPVQNLAAITGLTQGTYAGTVTDAAGCTAVVTASITQPDSLSLSLNPTQVSCFGGSNGAALALAGGGTAPYTYSWNTQPAQNTVSVSGLTSGVYQVTLSDDAGCWKTASVTITEPPALTASIGSIITVSCQGGNNGSATVAAQGGTSPYTYTWNTAPAQNTATAFNLNAGTFVALVTDANGCQAADTVQISGPGALSVSLSATPVSCFGENTGTATAYVSGGTAPYNYQWNTSPQQNQPTVSGLIAGNYSVMVTDAMGCSAIASVSVTQPQAPLGATVGSQQQVSCHGGADGSATIATSGGTAPYSYYWNSVPAQAGATASGLGAGSYAVTVTDAQGCAYTVPVVITEPPSLSVTMSANPVLCHGGQTGTASASVTGGTAPYSYLWNNNLTTSGIGGLSAGTYSVTVTDNNGCNSTGTVLVATPAAALSGAISHTDIGCFGGQGTATIAASGGTIPYTYHWNSIPAQTNATAVNLPAGRYQVTVTDANGCVYLDSVLIAQPPNMVSASVSVGQHVSCHGGADGAATALATGGVAPYSYSWSTTPVQAGPLAANLPAGPYTVTITDSNGCTTTAAVAITQPAALTGLLNHTDVLCYGDSSGSAGVILSGGTPPYSYNWTTAATGSSVTGLPAGSYTVTAADAKGCLYTATTQVGEPAALQATIAAATDISCAGLTDGTATVSASGGSAPYSYLWSSSPAQAQAAATGLPAGSYTVAVTDQHGCGTSAAVVIQDVTPLITNIVNPVQVSCFGAGTGAATALVSGGKPPYSYMWNSTPLQGTSTATGLYAGTYLVTVTDSNGCSQQDTVSITEPSQLQVQTLGMPACPGTAEGMAVLSAHGGVPPYTYNWIGIPGNHTDTVQGLSPGSYPVQVTDANGCVEEALAEVPAFPAAEVKAGEDVRLCFGSSLQLEASGALAYRWFPSTGLSCADCPSPTVFTDTGMNYMVTGTDINGCVDTDYVSVAVVPRVPVSIGGKLEICEGSEAVLSAAGGVAYSWSPAGSLSNSQASNPSAAPQTTTVYQVVITENECFSDTLTQEVVVHALPTVNLGPDLTVIAGTVMELPAEVSNAEHIRWDPPTDLSCSDCWRPIATLHRTITYTAMVTNALGCSAWDDIVIQVKCDNSVLFMPNTFTPNGDGNNDTYFPVGRGITAVRKFAIYNRWGQKLYEVHNVPANEITRGWDGVYRGEQLKPDVFVYMVEAECSTGELIVQKGDVSLIR